MAWLETTELLGMPSDIQFAWFQALLAYLAKAATVVGKGAQAAGKIVAKGAEVAAEGAATAGKAAVEGAVQVGEAVAEGAETVGTAVAEGAETAREAAGTALEEAAGKAFGESGEGPGLIPMIDSEGGFQTPEIAPFAGTPEVAATHAAPPSQVPTDVPTPSLTPAQTPQLTPAPTATPSTNPPDIQSMLDPKFGGPQVTPTQLGTPTPAIGRPTPKGVLPTAGSAPFTGSGMGSTKLGATGSGAELPTTSSEVSLGLRIKKFLADMKQVKKDIQASEPYKTAESFVDAKNTLEGIGGEVQEARVSGQPAPAEQAIAPTPQQQIPQLRRIETTGGLGLKEGEKPLTTNQIQGLQSEAILALVSELRTQRRLFG
jgi:hypothetical protein